MRSFVALASIVCAVALQVPLDACSSPVVSAQVSQQPLPITVESDASGKLLLRLPATLLSEETNEQLFLTMFYGMHLHKSPQPVCGACVQFTRRGGEVFLLSPPLHSTPHAPPEILARLSICEIYPDGSLAVDFGAALLDQIADALIRKAQDTSKYPEVDTSLYSWAVKQTAEHIILTAHAGSAVTTSETAVSFALERLPEIPMTARFSNPAINSWLVPEVTESWSQPRQAQKDKIMRWRLENVDPSRPGIVAARRPIKVYLDPELPLDIQEPIKEGILSWNEAFLRIGYQDVIEVHAASGIDLDAPGIIAVKCGYIENFGGSGVCISDPRSGEILSAGIEVSRWMYEDIAKRPDIQLARPVGSDERVDARVAFANRYWRYLGQHEMGHVLGLGHNFRASMWLSDEEVQAATPTEPISASCMDYYAPDFSPDNSVQNGLRAMLGPYDYSAIAYHYGTDFEATEAINQLKEQGIGCNEVLGDFAFDGTTLKYDCSSSIVSYSRRAFAAYLDAESKNLDPETNKWKDRLYIPRRIESILKNLASQIGSRSCRNEQGRYVRVNPQLQLEALKLFLEIYLHPQNQVHRALEFNNDFLIEDLGIADHLLSSERLASLMDAQLEGDTEQPSPAVLFEELVQQMQDVELLDSSGKLLYNLLLAQVRLIESLTSLCGPETVSLWPYFSCLAPKLRKLCEEKLALAAENQFLLDHWQECLDMLDEWKFGIRSKE